MSRQIILKTLSLKNFKGVKELTVNFGHTTDIYGDNGTGKSSVFDAFNWLLFDKDSSDRKKFAIKTLDKNNEVLHGLDHQVTAILSVDGIDIKLSKIHREKWTKKKGESVKALTGDETVHYIDDLPVKQSEYTEKINSLINEDIFKLITNPLYFSMNMKLADRRKVIFDIIGDISVEDVLARNEKLRELEGLLGQKDIEMIKRSAAARLKQLKEDVNAIPYKIDELNNLIELHDFEALESEMGQYTSALNHIEEELLKQSKALEKVMKDRNYLYKLKDKLHEIEVQAKSDAYLSKVQLIKELGRCEKEISKAENDISRTAYLMRSKQEEADKIEIQVDKLRKKYEAVKSEEPVISEDSFICKTCKRAFDPEDIEAMRVHMLEDLYREKAETLNGINVEGKPQKERWLHLKEELAALGPELKEYNSKLSGLTDQRLKLNAGIENFTPHINLLENEEYMKISKEAKELEAGLSEPAESTCEELKEAKRELSGQMDECRKKLLIREQNEKFTGRIAELMEQKSVLDKQIGSLEAREILCDEFVKTKAKLLESRINSKFKFVTFKLINTLKNGAVEEEWEALIDGVPFSSANMSFL